MSITFLALADLHHEPQVFPHDAQAFLNIMFERAKETQSAFMVQLGDFLHTPKLNGALADVYADLSLPTYNVVGNHDTDQESFEYILRMYRLGRGYYYFDQEGYRFIVLDPNYAVVDGVLTHYEPDNQGGKRNHQFGEIPPEQLTWLSETISDSPYPCVLFSHQSLERTDGILNRDAVWNIICSANRKKPRSVILCVNGHYHCDYCTIVNGVCCLDLNSSSYFWSGKENNLYTPDMYEKFPLARYTIYYNNPLSAVITIDGTDRIHISGAAGEYIVPISHEEILEMDQERLSDDRICTPSIRSYTVDLAKNSVIFEN